MRIFPFDWKYAAYCVLSISKFTKTKIGTFEVEIENGAQRMIEILSNMSGASPAEYVGTGDRDEKFLANIYFARKYFMHIKNRIPFLLR